MHAIEHLTECAWKRPDSYGGFSPDGDYMILSRHRDSDTITRSNWEVACESLKAEAWDSRDMEGRPAVYHWRAGHWAVGWVEYLCVRADAPDDVLTEAGEIVCSLADYPILSDDHHSDLEYSEACELWERESVRGRFRVIKDSGARVSIFAARRDELPNDDSDAILDYLRG